ncbi:MAG TPA: hypothetical protein VF121_19790, partial [Thermoanaerobaculia bacterium]|nr:hypothetical protein [Thermoanaerobaculia bacterium]
PLPAGDPRLARCGECWARRACGRSAELATPAGELAEPGWGASPDLCGYRRAEVFAALALVRRLEGRQGVALRRLDEMAAPVDPFAHAPLPWQALALA